MRTNTLSINTNLQNDKKAKSIGMKKHILWLCLLGALIMAGFSARPAEASCQGGNNANCQAIANTKYMASCALCFALEDPLLVVPCIALAENQYQEDCNNCDEKCPPEIS